MIIIIIISEGHSYLTLTFALGEMSLSNPFRIRILLFLSDSFGIETINTSIHSCSPPKPYPIADNNGRNLPLFQTERAQTLYLYMAFIRKYPPELIGPE